MFVPLACSLLPKSKKVNGTSVGYTYPKHIDKCTKCGWEAVAPRDCPIEMSDDPVTWTEKQDGMGPNGGATCGTCTGVCVMVVSGESCAS